ncbi:MAG: cyclic nucleotide-binding domain-containing protein [Pseudomonadota bacterium]
MIETHPMQDLIRQHAVLATIGDDVAAMLAGCAQNVVFRDGEALMREGTPADRFYLVRSGRVAVETAVPGRGVAIIQTAEAGEAVGLSWLVPPYQTDFGARAVGLVRALSFDTACLRMKCDADPHVGYELYKCLLPALVERLRTARYQSLDLYATGAEQAGP